MLNIYTLQKELLNYGFSWEEVEHYTRHPEELENLLKTIEENKK